MLQLDNVLDSKSYRDINLESEFRYGIMMKSGCRHVKSRAKSDEIRLKIRHS